jgi:SAM-dependent MidA family methyltransferase
VNSSASSVSEALRQQIVSQSQAGGGWLSFDAFMQAALYTPGLGYYTHGLQKFGSMPQMGQGRGSDFVTAPELSPLFGACLADQAMQVWQATGTQDIYEFGAGSGALALQICEHTSQYMSARGRYFIIEISSELRQRQRERLAHLGDRVVWLEALPERMEGVILGNEVLDAMPVKLLVRKQGIWYERGVVWQAGSGVDPDACWAWQDRPTALRPPLEVAGGHDYLTEIHPQAEAFLRTLADHLQRGAAFLMDYGFPEAEYYHPQRHMGTVMCHYQHQADPDPLDKVGQKDITAHVNFTGAALAAQEAGLDVLGYTSQGRFLLNCGLLDKAEKLSLQARGPVSKLVTEHEMGELFKVLALGKGLDLALMGFVQGDRTRTL